MVDQARDRATAERPSTLTRALSDTQQDAPDAVVIDLRDGVVVDIGTAQEARPEERVLLRSDDGILGAPKWELAIKRAVDVASAVFFLVVLSPLLILTALAVKLTSDGPLLYKQERVGKNGEVFKFAKFRSMREGAHGELEHFRHLNEMDGPVFKIREDPRITPLGRVMRKYSIDELPQFFHVLTGRMSLVGPRPPLPAEVATYDEWQRQRLLTKPGITCIWQVSGRNDLDFETWVEMDIEYIRTWKPSLDFMILLKTIPAVVTARGAY
jgi:lipopolysaccharide/colanic/teichoic acid biosynthesis glycosyltransferase